jgi:cytoskeletal protein RodZ
MGYMRIMMVALALLLGIISMSTINVIAQTNQTRNGGPSTDSASDNITTQIMPQGTSVETDNNTKATSKDTPTSPSSSGNVTSEIAPQGTSIQEANQTSTKKNNTTSTVGRAGIDNNNIGNVKDNNE